MGACYENNTGYRTKQIPNEVVTANSKLESEQKTLTTKIH